MTFNFPVFSLIFILGGILTLYYATVIYMRRPAPGATAFTIFAIAITFWLFCRVLEAGAVDIQDKIFWGKMMFFGAIPSGLTWLIFCLEYTGNKWARKPFNLFLIVVFPLISLIFIWTNQFHGLYWPEIYPSPGTNGTILVWVHGPVWWLAAAFNYIYTLVGGLILWRYLIRNQGIFRRQLGVLLVGTLIPLVANVAYALGLSPIKGLDLTPFGITIAGLFYAVTIFKFRLLDVVPVARNMLVEKVPDGIMVVDIQRMLMDINPAAEIILGEKRKKVFGRSLQQVWPQLESRLLGNPQAALNEYIELDWQGTCLDINVIPILDAKHKSVGELIVLRDVTERRKMEQSLRESEARYAALVEQSNEGVLIIQKGVFVFANRTITEISGYAPQEILNQSMLMMVAEEDRAMVAERYQKRQAGQTVPDNYEIQMIRKDGEKRAVELSVGTILYEGAVAHIVSARDISERKQTQRQLEGLYEEERKLRGSLQEEIEKRSKYTRALVHELNTPLTSILASGELLEAEVEEPTLAALVKNIRRSSHNLKQRIDELIELARGEIGMLKINAMPVDMERLLREVESEMRPLAKGKGLELKVEVGELPLALGDRGRLRQVLLNLISNALKFTQKGEVEVKGEVAGEYVKVSVRDSGRGIGKEQLENIFDPYRRKVNEGQEMGGLGIGLTLSKMFVDLHRGEIKVESEVGRGSVFSFTIPLYKEEEFVEKIL